jgi:hypothetical protein
MLQQRAQAGVDERTVELIATRVTVALREDIEALLAAFDPPKHHTTTPSLTVEQLAARLGVARSTVYAHWREWGGYKLGAGQKAPIRFDQDHAPSTDTDAIGETARKNGAGCVTRRRRRRDELISDAPRWPHPLDDLT